MKSSAKNISLTSLDDIFTTEESRSTAEGERIVEIRSLSFTLPGHPFSVNDDDLMTDDQQY